jgi:hypothetical protein
VTDHRHRAAQVVGRGRRPGPAVLLVAVLPLVTLVAALAHGPAQQQGSADTQPARRAPLTQADLTCPGAREGAGELVLGSAPGSGGTGSGEATARQAGTTGTIPVRLRPGGQTTSRSPAGAALVRVTGALAPGLYGARIGAGSRPAAGECVTPAGERWFVGVGAGGDHTASLLLTNPDVGPAVADVTLWSTDGPLEEVESRGLTIPGGQRTRLDLSTLAPHRHDLAMRVAVARGRVAALVGDRYRIGGAPASADWVAPAGAPATSLVVPALPRRAGERTLVLANPGSGEARVTLEVAGRDSTFRPTGVPEIRVPAGRVVETDLTGALRDAVRAEDGALLIASNTPVVGAMRSMVAGDLVHAPALEAGSGRSVAVVPDGGVAVLALTPTTGSGVVDIAFLGTDRTERTALELGSTRRVPVPARATAVLVRSGAPYVGAVRTVGADGAALLPLRTLQVDQLIPHVVPARRSAQSPR